MCSDFVALKMADLFSHWLVLEKRSGIKLFKLQTRKSIMLKFEFRSAAKPKIMKSKRLWCMVYTLTSTTKAQHRLCSQFFSKLKHNFRQLAWNST